MTQTDAAPAKPSPLKKELGLWDVYVISTGAMFSSGFFLLPGIASANAGPSVVLAYLLAGVLMVPAMLSMAELSTALPRAGGTYYFLDRSLGPAMGTVGGLGTWLALVLKSGFALLGMGAYLAITPGLGGLLPQNPDQALWVIKALAVALTVVFTALNIAGAKETTRLQSLLVTALLGVLAFFVVQGLWYVFFRLPPGEIRHQFTPFYTDRYGVEGMIATIGLVFVSYAGLTKVASVSEEVKQPERNLPLGMFLSLLTATAIYVVGVFIMVSVLEPDELRRDYTPVATAAEAFFGWLPEPTGLILVVIAALAAFASTGNAGIMSASRYPLAMSRDHLVTPRFKKLGRTGTPTLAILATAAMMIFFILVLSAEGVAKLASAFNLFVFGLVNVAVIVMRESHIESYDPGYRSPLYPWTQIVGVVIAVWLIAQMGWLTALMSLGLGLVGLAWYFYYARRRVMRYGAIYHVFARLGRRRFEELDQEFRQIIKEKGLRDQDPFDEVITRAGVIDAPPDATFDTLIEQASEHLAQRTGLPAEVISQQFHESGKHGNAPIAHEAILPHFRAEGIDHPEIVLARCISGVYVQREAAPPGHSQQPDDETDEDTSHPPTRTQVKAVFFLLSPENDAGMHLRILAQIAARLESEDFALRWADAQDDQAIKETFLRDERFLALWIEPNMATAPLIGRQLAEIEFPENTVVTMVRRDSYTFVPSGHTVLQAGDRITVVGEPEGITKLAEQYTTRKDAEA